MAVNQKENSYKILRILVLISWFCYNSFMEAQIYQFDFKSLSTNDGLSQSWIRCIYQDKYGLIWIGTDDGLNVYDGYEFKVYKYDTENENTLNSNTIKDIVETPSGDLWIGTLMGLNYYDRKRDCFIHKKEWPNQNIRSITKDDNNNLYITTTNAVFYYIRENDSIINLIEKYRDFPKEHYNSVYIDSKKKIWITTGNGLLLFNPQKRTFKQYLLDETSANGLEHNRTSKMFEDSYGRLWIGTSVGLSLFLNHNNPDEKGIFIHYDNDKNDTNSISSGPVFSIIEDKKSNLWIGTENGGLNILSLKEYNKNKQKAHFYHYTHDPNIINSLSNNSIHSLFQDKQGNIWIGTFGNGLNIVYPYNNGFVHFKHELHKNSLSNNHVNVILEDGDNLWIGTEGGLNRYDKSSQKFTHYFKNQNNPQSISSNAIWALCKDKTDNILIGTWAGGINIFDYKSNTFSHPFKNLLDTIFFPVLNIFSIIQDNHDNFWVGTVGGGLVYLDIKNNIFHSYNITNSNISGNFIEVIIQSNNGELWIENGNPTGQFIERFDPEKKEFEKFRNIPGDKTSLSSTKIYSLYEDSKGNLWVGTDVGLNLFDKSTKKFSCYKTKDGLPDNSIRSILEDDNGNLWLGTTKGLSKFVKAINISNKPVFKNYTIEDGLQANEFVSRSCTKGSDGTLYFGGVNGFNMFHPDSLKENDYIPNVIITRFSLFNKQVEIDADNSPLKQNIIITKEIVLKHNQSVFSFKFSALNYILSQKNQYAYKMDGFDKDWNYVGDKREATYTNLNPGEYNFKVKASNNDGIWNEKGVSIKVIILAPWWKTIWFKILLFTVIIASAISFHYIRFSFIKQQKEKLEKLVKERTFHLEESTIQLEEQQEEINQQKEELQSQRDTLYNANQLLENQKKQIIEQNKELYKHRNELEELIDERTKELIVAKEKAEESDRLKSSFLANLSHEIRTPLNAIMGFSNILSSEELSQEEISKFNQIVQNSGISLLNLIDDIIDFSKIESGHISINIKEIPLKRILENVNQIFNLQLNHHLPKNEQKLEFKIVTDINLERIVLKTDELRLNQILANLINNAIKFTSKGKIEVGYNLINTKNLVEFYVQDTGIGIRKEKQQFIFQRFTKIEENPSELHRGAGLGLAICYQLVQLLGGIIRVESEPMAGSTFYFTIPFKIGFDNEPSTNYFMTSKIPDLIGHKIIIAEDDDANYEYIEKLMERTNSEIIRAKNGIEVLSILNEENNISLILMDIKMPKMNGIDTLNEIRKKQIVIPVVAQTAHALADEIIMLKEAGFDEYISKPIIAKELYNKINKILKI